MAKRSVYRFLASAQPGGYSVWRGDHWLGHVTKQVHRVTERGRTTTIVAGWRPSNMSKGELPLVPTREEAAAALWHSRGEAT